MLLKTKSLPPKALQVVLNKGTEPPFTGTYDNWNGAGSYLCRHCGMALFRSQTKFHSGCGWPSFDEELPMAITQKIDADGQRTEILCARCQAHLGHVFHGEKYTAKNARYCVNSLSLDFVPDQRVTDTAEAIYAAGCFWGVEYYFKQLPGVLKAEVGYCGGHKPDPTYEEVCRGNTGHVEAVRVIYDPKIINYEKLTQYFFEIHDPSQQNGQGPDLGGQYLSMIFYYNEEQKKTAEELTMRLEKKGLAIATQLAPVTTFWRAEDYHQAYYHKQGKEPYCHRYEKRF